MARVECYPRLSSRLFLSMIVCASLVGCGYKAPLYLPPPPDTLKGQVPATSSQRESIPPESKNPSLEPAPIVIE